jgi:FMN reductase
MTLVLGLGGTPRAGSSTELALAGALAAAQRNGAQTCLFDGEFLVGLPHYGTAASRECLAVQEFIEALRRADGLIIASPGYHGTVSGLMKNAIDYVEETARDKRPYFEGLPVGLIVTAFGSQATGTTLMAMRSIVHALRGWPTPFGVSIQTRDGLFVDGQCTDAAVSTQLELLASQVVNFAMNRDQTGGTVRAA